jgi:Ca2+-binding EF-hand superfamily protein
MSNTINFNEFKQAFTGANMPDQEMRQLFKQLDVNSDGEINFEEFLTGVRDRRLANSKAGRLLSNSLRD